MTTLTSLFTLMMTAGHHSAFSSAAITTAAIVSVLGGFGLLRLSAAFESYILLFLSFGLMVWGLLALFTEHGRPKTA